MFFSKYIEEELEITDIKKVNKKIVENYLAFTKYMGKYSFASSEAGIEKADLYKRHDVGKEISDVTINEYLRNIKAFFTYVEENNLVKKSNIHSIKSLS
ncbi:hypothetical protein JCM1393_27620 [Clostridium carnis]